MHTVLLLLSAAATINAWTPPTKAVHKLRVPPRRDEDRCFYGEVGVDGSVVAGSPRYGADLCENLISGAQRHRRDLIPVTASARWRGT